MDPMTLAVAGVAAAAIFLIAIGIATSGSGSGVSARLERYASARQSGKARGDPARAASPTCSRRAVALAQLNRVVEQRDFGANLARDIARADLKLKPSEFLAIWAGAIIGIPLLFVVVSLALPALRSPIALLVGAFLGFLLPRFWLNRRKAGRLGAFNKQLPDTITLLANGLRAGSSFLQAVELVVRESRPPISTEFSRVIREVNLGLPFEQAHGEHGPPRPVRRPRADGDRHQHPAHRRRQPRRDPRLDRVHDPRADPDQGRDPDPDRAAAPVGLRRRLPADRPRRLPVRRRARTSWSRCSQKPPEALGLPLGVVILFFGGFMMFIGFMLIRRIVDIEV